MLKLISPTEDWGPSHVGNVTTGEEITEHPAEAPSSSPGIIKVDDPLDEIEMDDQELRGDVNANDSSKL